jgi:hypothetical protein
MIGGTVRGREPLIRLTIRGARSRSNGCPGGKTVELDTNKIDEAVLALLYLGLHNGVRAWKGFDWDAMDRLHQAGYITDPRGKAKSVVFTEEGLERAKCLLAELFCKQAEPCGVILPRSPASGLGKETVMVFYKGRKDPGQIREYDGHTAYNLYDVGSNTVSVFPCKPQTIKAWGIRISEEEARRMLPNLDQLRSEAEHGRQWMNSPQAPPFCSFWTPEFEEEFRG